MLQNNTIKLHLTVFIWGFTAILGQLITKSALILVWYRLLIACIALFLYLKWNKVSFRLEMNHLWRFLSIGFIVALHWVFFYDSIKVSKISVSLVALSSITLFTGILDPLLNRRKVDWLDIWIGLAIMVGILFIFKYESNYALGTFLGIMAALLASLFTIFNSREVKKNPIILVSFYELFGGFILISSYIGVTGQFTRTNLHLIPSDLIYLIILGVVCTALAYVMGFAVMKTLSPYTVNLITSLEPIYGIILAFLFFGKSEALKPGFYLGAFIILCAIFMHPVIKNLKGRF